MTLTRGTAMGLNGAIATPHYLATAAGFQLLRDGGNAIDAAIAANAVLGLVRPDQTTIGGDLFMLIWPARERRVLFLNSSGRAGAKGTPDFVRSSGYDRLPEKGPLSVLTPGCVAGWAAALERFGTRELGSLLQPAIDAAEGGVAAAPLFANRLAAEADNFNEAARQVFMPNGKAPKAGDPFRNPEYAESLRLIAREGPRVMYEGALGHKIGSYLDGAGGHLTPADLAVYEPDWSDPAHMPFGDFQVNVIPPNSQAILHLIALGIMQGVDVGESMGGRQVHLQVEATRLAYQDRGLIADPRFMPLGAQDLLAPNRLAAKRKEIEFERAWGQPPSQGHADTVYVAVADREGNVVSLIQSLRKPFGSGVVVPGTGILMNDRGRDFGIEAGDPNQIAPGKRSRHTLTPAIAVRGGRPAYAYGTAGGDVQPYTMLQLSTNLLIHGMGPQEAVDAPRWTVVPAEPGPAEGAKLGLEDRFNASTYSELEALGYTLQLLPAFEDRANLGSVAAAIQIDHERGVFLAGADPRADGIALAW
jgi:gamma-glutamyltranspeptidase / glutathione hydrolase